MMIFWEKYKTQLAVVSYIFLVFAFSCWVVFPYLARIKEKSDDIQGKLIDNEMSEARLKKIPEMEDAFNKYKENKSALEVVLDPDSEVDFIKKIENIALETGNRITLKILDDDVNKSDRRAVARGQEEKPISDELTHKERLSMEINLEGDYLGLINFMNKLENLNPYVNVLTISLKKEAAYGESSSQVVSSDGLFNSTEIVSDTPLGGGKEGKEFIASSIGVVVYIKK